MVVPLGEAATLVRQGAALRLENLVSEKLLLLSHDILDSCLLLRL